MGKSRQATLNPTQTRPLRRASVFSACVVSGLLGAQFSCNAADRQQSAPHSPPPLPPAPSVAEKPDRADSAAATPPAAATSAPQPLLLDSAAVATSPTPLPPPAPTGSDAGAPDHYVIAAIGDSLTDPRSHGGG